MHINVWKCLTLYDIVHLLYCFGHSFSRLQGSELHRKGISRYYKILWTNAPYLMRFWTSHTITDFCWHHLHHHHHKNQELDPLIRSVSRVKAARANASSVFQLFSFLAVCSGMISKGFGFVTFFAIVKASSVCIHLSCLVCL